MKRDQFTRTLKMERCYYDARSNVIEKGCAVYDWRGGFLGIVLIFRTSMIVAMSLLVIIFDG